MYMHALNTLAAIGKLQVSCEKLCVSLQPKLMPLTAAPLRHHDHPAALPGMQGEPDMPWASATI